MSDTSRQITALTTKLSGSADERAAAAEALAQLGNECADACIPLVRACGTDELTREWAAAALEEMGPPPEACIPGLLELASDPSGSVVYWAVTLLGRSQAAGACNLLAKLVDSDHEDFVRERAVWAIRQIGCPAATVQQALLKASQSENPRLARLAKEAIT